MTMTTTTHVDTFDNWGEIVPALDLNGGVLVCTMGALRDIDGYRRNGTNVRQSIARKLATLGVSALADELPHDAPDPVILYRQGTAVSTLVETVETATAGGGDVTAAAESLRRINAMPDPNSVLAKLVAVRELIRQALGDSGIPAA